MGTVGDKDLPLLPLLPTPPRKKLKFTNTSREFIKKCQMPKNLQSLESAYFNKCVNCTV